MVQLKHPLDELEQLHKKSTERIYDALIRVARAATGRGDYRQAQKGLYDQILTAMQYADLLGRRRVLLELNAIKARRGDQAAQRQAFHDKVDPWAFLPRRCGCQGILAIRAEGIGFGKEGPPFKEMIEDLLARTPKLAATADEVAEQYRTMHAFAAVGSPDLEVTKAVQRELADIQTRGDTLKGAEQAIQAITGWARWYSETVFRTNVTTAYSAGRWKQVSDPIVEEIAPAFEYAAVLDVDTRPNHAAANGLVAGLRDPIWNTMTPPLGYNCRCTLMMVDVFELKSRGLIDRNGIVKRVEPAGFSAAGPDSARFGGGRPDRRIYGF